MDTGSLIILVWIAGALVCFELMFHIFERAEVGFSTKDIAFAVADAILSVVWPVYVPWTLVRRIFNTRKLKTQ